jgi:hypothetical protein
MASHVARCREIQWNFQQIHIITSNLNKKPATHFGTIHVRLVLYFSGLESKWAYSSASMISAFERTQEVSGGETQERSVIHSRHST